MSIIGSAVLVIAVCVLVVRAMMWRKVCRELNKMSVTLAESVVITRNAKSSDSVPVVAAVVSAAKNKENREFNRAMAWCRQVTLSLPDNYFRGWEAEFQETGVLFPAIHGEDQVVYPITPFSQSTYGASVPPAVKERLWGTPEFCTMVRNLFWYIPQEDMKAVSDAALAGIASGYHEHDGRFIFDALMHNLVGAGAGDRTAVMV